MKGSLEHATTGVGSDRRSAQTETQADVPRNRKHLTHAADPDDARLRDADPPRDLGEAETRGPKFPDLDAIDNDGRPAEDLSLSARVFEAGFGARDYALTLFVGT